MGKGILSCLGIWTGCNARPQNTSAEYLRIRVEFYLSLLNLEVYIDTGGLNYFYVQIL